MVKLIPVEYHRCTYPPGIAPRLREVTGHFGKERVPTDVPFSLHTEYSAAARTPSRLTRRFSALCESYCNGIPLLWTSEEWAVAFVAFLRELCGSVAPAVLEIHPPYQGTCNFSQFFQRFALFEEQFRQWAPKTFIVMENRTGNRLNQRFLLSTYKSFLAFSQLLDSAGSDLRIAFDVPQILTAHDLYHDTKRIAPLLEHLKAVRHNMGSIHLWGRNPKAHWGDLNTTFGDNQAVKHDFLSALSDLLDDGTPRYFVPEVNSGNADFQSILGDLCSVGFTFT